MSKFVCECGKDCGTHLGLSKHKTKCDFDPNGLVLEHEKFSNRFVNALAGETCPICLEIGKPFYKEMNNPHSEKEVFVCLECGVHFSPKTALDKLKAECARIKWKRPQT